MRTSDRQQQGETAGLGPSIRERRERHQRLQRLQRTQALSRQAHLAAVDGDDLLRRQCHVLTDAGYVGAWIGRLDGDGWRIMASSGAPIKPDAVALDVAREGSRARVAYPEGEARGMCGLVVPLRLPDGAAVLAAYRRVGPFRARDATELIHVAGDLENMAIERARPGAATARPEHAGDVSFDCTITGVITGHNAIQQIGPNALDALGDADATWLLEGFEGGSWGPMRRVEVGPNKVPMYWYVRSGGRGATIIALPDGAVAGGDAGSDAAARILDLEATNAMRAIFLNVAAHELNTPLTPMRILVEALRRSGDLNAKGREYVEIIERNVLQMGELVRDLLDASRLQTGRLKLNTTPIRLPVLIHDAMETFTENARGAGVELHAGPIAPATVAIDGSKFNQVLANLVSNAIKFTPKGGQVTLTATADDEQATICVRDTGLGLTDEQREQLFQPFGRPHQAVAPGKKGTGLGLFISKGIVEQHKGKVWAESKGKDCGSTFYVTVPLGRSD